MPPPRCHQLSYGPTLTKRVALLAPRPPVASTRRCAVRVVADLSARGRPILPKSVTVERIMGEGSFGQVFGGLLSTPTGNQRVVMKRVKTRVQGAEEMSQMEHLLNVYASRVARGHCADFLGYCEVDDSEATGRLTPGLWLVWKYEGSKTLSYYLRRRDTLRALATDLEVPESIVVPAVMRHIFEGLAAFHAAGLVHRDVKPLNMIMAEDVRRFKLIDLGACADLRSGTNYVPEESILDLNFCPPEQFVMPTDSPHIAKQAGLIKLAISPMLWAKHKPDRFDTWSAGIVMLQLAIPAMRTDRTLRNFNSVYGPKYKYDLAAWRKGTHLSSRDCALLDADDGAGWDLLQSLLAPRHIQVDDNGGVSFVNDTPFQRISAFEALKHRYIKGAVEAAAAPFASTSGSSTAAAASTYSKGGPSADSAAVAGRRGRTSGGDAAAAAAAADSRVGSKGASTAASGGASTSGGGGDPLGSALGVWRDMTGRLFDLEARIMRQTSATELQTTTVRRLKEQVESGKVDPALLQKEEKVLSKMQARLAGLQQDFSATANQASGLFSFFGFGGSNNKQQQQAQQQDLKSQRDSKSSQSLQALRNAEVASAAAAATSASPSASTSFSTSSPSSLFSAPSAAGMFNSVWERLSSRLGELERKISNQASATERQSLVVRGLRAKVKAGEAEPEMLAKAERTLSRMERRLLDLDRDYWSAKQNAKGALAGNMPSDNGGSSGRRGGSGSENSSRGDRSTAAAAGGLVAETSAAAAAVRHSDSDSETGGSFWSRLLRTGSSRSSGSSMDGSIKEATALQSSSPVQPLPEAPQHAVSPLFRRATSPTRATAPQQQPQPPPQSSQTPQPQPPPQSGGSYRSVFGAFATLGNAAKSSSSSSAASAAAADTPAAATATAAQLPQRATTPLMRSISPFRGSTSGGGGGLFGGLFGGGGGPPRQQQPAEQEGLGAVQAAAPSSAAGSGRSASASASASSASAAAVTSTGRDLPAPVSPPLPAAPSMASGGDALLEGASRVIRNSLGFTGLAARIAGDLATAFKADAERYLKELEVQEAAKRQQRTLDLAFLALLREAQPPVRSSCSFEEASERFGGEARWAALADEGRRRELYGKYLMAAKKVEEQAAAAADAAFRAALRRYQVTATSRWEDFQSDLEESDPAVAGVQDPARRQQLFLEVVSELQLQAALQAASLKAEMEFTTMLADLREPPVTSTSTWSLVRRGVANDPRCQALPERRRRELFEAFTARLFEEEARRSELAVAAAQAAEEEEAAKATDVQTEGQHERQQSTLPATTATAAAAATTALAPRQQPRPLLAIATAAVAGSAPATVSRAYHAVPSRLPATTTTATANITSSFTSSSSAQPTPASTPSLSSSPPPAAAAAPAVAAVVSLSSASSSSTPLDDDEDLAAVLAGMEAALESAIKAVSSVPPVPPVPPLPSTPLQPAVVANGITSSMGGVGAGSANNVVVVVSGGVPGASSAGSGSGVGGTAAGTAAGSVGAGVWDVSAPAAANMNMHAGLGAVSEGLGAAATAAESIRLEELRREQARLRAEYEAMAQRLREMEERLKSQAQLMTSVVVEAEEEGEKGPGVNDRDDDEAMTAVPWGGQRWRR